MSATSATRAISIDLPENLASELERIAAAESRDLTSLLAEGCRRLIFDRIDQDLQVDRAEAMAKGGNRYTEADIERLVHEVRMERAVTQPQAQSKRSA